jgi:putative transposase
VGYLRSQSRAALIRSALEEQSRRGGFRVVHYSIQGNHLHLIVEAAGARALSRAMQRMGSKVARGLNRLAARRGGVFVDRYHAHVLRTPREVANAIRYLRENFRRHARHLVPMGWQDELATTIEAPLSSPRVWLLTVGWRRVRDLAPP